MIKKRHPLFLLAKLLVLQSFFFLATKYGPQGYDIIIMVSGICLMLINFFFIRDMIEFKPYFAMMCLFFFSGFIQDTIFIRMGFIKLDMSYPPLFFPTLWLTFFGFYGDVFRKMLTFPIWLMSTLGALGGTLAYYRGLSQINIEVHDYLYLFIAIIWVIFMPISLKLFLHFQNQKLKKVNA